MKEKAQRIRLTVVYDGECNFCLATVDKLRRLPLRAELQFVPLQQLLGGVMVPWPGIDDVPLSELSAQMHVTDEQGQRYSGADGVLKLMSLTPGLSFFATLGRLPGMYGIVRTLYRLVARYRYRLFGRTSCSDGVCSLPQRTTSAGGKK
jgi:predicted DCC family thiol-disulfide oxidoreductase YuxK